MSRLKIERATVKIERPTVQLQAQRVRIHRPKPGYQKPDFDSLFGDPPAEETPNPLEGLPDDSDLETVATGEVSAVLAGILAERKAKRDAYRLIQDKDYWCCLCFQSREQKDAFLAAKGWDDLGDKYLNGLTVAAREGVPIEPIDLPARENRAKLPKSIRNVEVIR